MLEKLRIRRDTVRKTGRRQEGAADSFYADGARNLAVRNQIPEELYIETCEKSGSW